ncbi:MAG: hypothetical protein ACO31I_18375 [Prochlorotrichaceae cyanobacterium]|jgi:hypothetical protein
MSDSKVVIHVGLQKTASTYLQSEFFPRLSDIVYIGRPYTQENYAFNTLQYADRSLYEPTALSQEIERIKEIAQDKPILISDELFSGYAFYNFINRGLIAERLSEVVPNAEIVLFLRGQVDLIISLYNQYVKTGWIHKKLDQSFLQRPGKGFSLEQWLKGRRKWNIYNRFIFHHSVCTPEHFRYTKLYSLYAQLFRKVHVFLYEDFDKNPEVCLSRIASILSVNTSNDVSHNLEKTVNKRLDSHQLRQHRLLNKLEPLGIHQKGIMQFLTKFISTYMGDHSSSNLTHVISLIQESELFEDNRILNTNFNFGMEQYPKSYFGE